MNLILAIDKHKKTYPYTKIIIQLIYMYMICFGLCVTFHQDNEAIKIYIVTVKDGGLDNTFSNKRNL